MAINLLSKIYNDLNIDIPMVNFFTNPNIESIGKEIIIKEKGNTADTNIIFNFHDDEEGNPIFFIHPSGGSVHWYHQLATELKGYCPFYGIQAVGVDGKAEPHHTIEEMASYYTSAIIAKQENGPYNIASWSMGVVVAYEVARQLFLRGKELGAIIILDQGPVLPLPKQEDDAEFLAGMFMGRIKFSLDKLRQMDYDSQLKYVLRKAKKAKQFPKHIRFNQFKNYVKILKIQQDAWRIYNPKQISNKLILIKSKERHDRVDITEDLGWGKLTNGNVEIFETPGDHNTMLHQPRVKELAKIIKNIIKK
ncbi:dimodular nonribosomal peptide synthase [bacterium BMS3Abin04]|nr:dimodular nonribosomal peptide synthase [bacterium BMS3Abin04]